MKIPQLTGGGVVKVLLAIPLAFVIAVSFSRFETGGHGEISPFATLLRKDEAKTRKPYGETTSSLRADHQGNNTNSSSVSGAAFDASSFDIPSCAQDVVVSKFFVMLSASSLLY